MSRVCQLTGTGPVSGNRIRRHGKAKKKGGIGMHVTKVVKRRFLPNLQRVKAIVDGEVKYIRVTAKAIKKGLVTKSPKRTSLMDTCRPSRRITVSSLLVKVCTPSLLKQVSSGVSRVVPCVWV